jgi:hypothetical protein
MTEQTRPDPADVPNLKEFESPKEETDADVAQEAYPTPGEEDLRPVEDHG